MFSFFSLFRHVIGKYLARPYHHGCVVRRTSGQEFGSLLCCTPAPLVTPEAFCRRKMQSGRHLFALFALLLLTLPEVLKYQVL